MSTVPSILAVRKTPARVGDQAALVRYDMWYLVVMIDDAVSSFQMRADQSPTERKNLGKNGLRWRA